MNETQKTVLQILNDFEIQNVNEMSIVAWYNNAIDPNTEMNMYPCLL